MGKKLTVNKNEFEVDDTNVTYSFLAGLAGFGTDTPVIIDWTHPDYFGGQMSKSDDWIPLEDGSVFTVREGSFPVEESTPAADEIPRTEEVEAGHEVAGSETTVE